MKNKIDLLMRIFEFIFLIIIMTILLFTVFQFSFLKSIALYETDILMILGSILLIELSRVD